MIEKILPDRKQRSEAGTFRVLVSTDLGGDPDDTQSLIHMLHYSDILKIEGLISTTGPGSTPRAENIRHWLRRTEGSHWIIRRAHAPAEVCQATINRWRIAYLSDWKKRWDWYDE